MELSLQQRVEAFRRAQPRFPDAWPYVSPSGRWLYGTWDIGAKYEAAAPYYGTYPPRVLEMIYALFPELEADQALRVLHLFSGALPHGPDLRIDINPALAPDVCADARRLPLAPASIYLAAADTPYSTRDAQRYGTTMPRRLAVMTELAGVVAVGGHVAWLDTNRPQYRADQWHAWGLINVQRSTNHRGRSLYLFERLA